MISEITAIESALKPSGDKAAAVVIEKSLKHFGQPDSWDELAPDYLDELSQVPTDLLNDVWLHARRNCRFFPKIPDLLDPIRDKISARQFKLMRLKSMLLSLQSKGGMV